MIKSSVHIVLQLPRAVFIRRIAAQQARINAHVDAMVLCSVRYDCPCQSPWDLGDFCMEM